jgi:methyltransferase (TIGR00027 family)
LIGAGFDSFALRRPAFSDALEIFELDHPATQAMKIQRIKQCGVSLPQSVHFVPTDLATEDLATALARSSFRNEPAFFSWLGVTVYLTREANLATLRAIATCGAPESQLVFSYVDQIEFAPSGRLRSPDNANARAVAMVGEPYVSGFAPDEIAKDLASVGIELLEDLDGPQMSERYRRSSEPNALRPPASLHLALTRVRSLG